MPAVCLLPYSLSLSLVSASVSLLSLSSLFIMLSQSLLVHVVAPRCLPSTFWGQIWAALFARLCVGNSALFALLLHPANTLSACLAALGSLDCTQTTLEIGLINIQYARITHSLVACSASRWAPLIKSISLSLSLFHSLHLTLPLCRPLFLSACLSLSFSLVPLKSIFQLYFVLHLQGICFISLTTVLRFFLSLVLSFFFYFPFVRYS